MDHRTAAATSRTRFRSALLMTAAAMVLSLLVPPAASAEEVAAPDGLATDTAAASCWEIKQNDPAAPDGVYWLQTPALVAPEQFYCDMTTDGGGWVLIARGREGWRTDYNGTATPAQVRDVVDGPSAFTVRQLPALTVDALLDGTRVDSLPDGIRLRRAMNTAGTTWQEGRFRFQSRDRWVWTFGAEHAVGAFSFDGVTGSGGLTRSFGGDSAFRRVDTRELSAQGWTWGLSYGGQVAGSNASDSHLWSATNGAGSARPFTQVFLRPRLLSEDLSYPVIAGSGAPEQTLRPLHESGTEATAWGVTGLANGVSTELTSEVAAFAQVGNRVYVGGNFRYVQRNGSGLDRVEQSYLAAFDVTTRQWVSSFRPRLDGQVKALAALPGGRLAVGGDFSTVNSVPQPGIVALNPTTGGTDSSFDVDLENRISGGGRPIVRGLSVLDDDLYLSGVFTHLAGGSRATPVWARSGARVSATDGTPDGGWNPNLNGNAVAVHASPRGDRVYFAGYFTTSQGNPALKAAAVSTASGAALVPWSPTYSASANYQQGIREVGDRVWLGGSEHSLFSYDRATMNRVSGNITKQGGDYQVVADNGHTVYAGCHCNEWNYADAYTWSNVGTGWSQADKIGLVGAWDSATGRYVPEFSPTIKGRRGYGAWAIFPDSTGRLWVGGDFVNAMRPNRTTQWVGGFVTFALRDSTAPTRPGSFAGTAVNPSTTRLSWTASSDSVGGIRYEVIRDDRVVAILPNTARSHDVPTDASSRWFVRAIDGAGNRSSSTAAVLVGPPARDTTAPTAPTNLRAGDITGTSIALAWDAATDDVGVTGYTVLRDGVALPGPVTATTFTDTGLTPGTAYDYQVLARDAAGNVGPASTTLAVSTVAPDTTPPSAPGGVQAGEVGSTSVELSWSAATDDTGVTGYTVVRDGAALPGAVTGTTFTDTGLTPSTTYTYAVRATDAAGNVGPASAAVEVTTQAPPPPPPAPGLAETWSGADASPWSSAWTTSTGNGGVVDTVAGQGRIGFSDTPGAWARAQATGAEAAADEELLTSYRWDSTSAVSWFNVHLRGSGGWANAWRPRNGYGLSMSSTSGTVGVQRVSNGSMVQVLSVPGGQTVTTDKQWLRFRVSGSEVSFRTWVDGQPEPSVWTTVTDTAVTAPGQLFTSVVRGGSNSGAKAVLLDDLELRSVTP